MQDHISLDGTPVNEPCAQVGTEGYALRQRAECQAYISQIRRQYRVPAGVRLSIEANTGHDFGAYYGVRVSFDDQDERACDFAYRLEGNGPVNWDREAKLELGIE